MNVIKIAEWLNKSDLGAHFDIAFYKEIESTNKELKELAELGNASEGKIIIAETQSEGRGRMGRTFFSPCGTGIYMSILLTPTSPAEYAVNITAIAAAATAKAIEKAAGKSTGIKWVNDIYLDGKKVCGILTEAATDTESGKLKYAVLGIGINVNEPENAFPEDIKTKAGAIFENPVSKEIYENLVFDIVKNFFRYYKNPETKEVLAEYRKRIMYKNEEINIINGEKTEKGILLGIEDDFSLAVKMPDGNIKKLNSGEISTRAARP